MKDYLGYIKDKIDNWKECPTDYEFSVGERVKINPNSSYAHQAYGNKIGTIVGKSYQASYARRSNECWYVKWDSGFDGCYYWREDLLMSGKLNREFLKKKELLKSKYKDIDPFEEEKWED